ncbi:MAG: DUF11 domain-containing protein [bacterium]|nr:DUF11 domain-containing protein [bacterium]
MGKLRFPGLFSRSCLRGPEGPCAPAGLLLATLLLIVSSVPAPADNLLVSAGQPGLDAVAELQSDQPLARQISDDGRYLVFTSYATNVVPGQVDTNEANDVFLYDHATDSATLVSHTPVGPTVAGNFRSDSPAISGDGAWVVFVTEARDLISTPQTRGGIYLYEVATGRLALASHVPGDPDTAAGSSGSSPVIDGDGSFAAYVSRSSDLIVGTLPGFTNQIYLYERATDTNILVSHASAGPTVGGNDDSTEPSISDDGGAVVFRSEASDLVAGFVDNNGSGSSNQDIFAFERATGTVSLVSRSTAGAAASGNGRSEGARVNGDGTFVVFQGLASNLLAGFVDNNGSFGHDVFLFELATGTTTLVSHSTAGPSEGGNNRSLTAVISADGGFVAFESSASDLVPGVSSSQIYLFERTTGTISLVSHSTAGPTSGGTGQSEEPAISADGSHVTFRSAASNLVAGTDLGFSFDVFLYERATGSISLVSHVAGSPTTAAGSALFSIVEPVINADGGFVGHQSFSSELVAGTVGGGVYVYEKATGVNSLASPAALPVFTTGNQGSVEDQGPTMSSDGRFVAYETEATNLIPGQLDRNERRDVFLFDRSTGQTALVSRSSAGPTTTATNSSSFGGSEEPVISRDGAYVVFFSFSDDVDVPGLTFGGSTTWQLYLYEVATGTISLVSHQAGNSTTSGNSAAQTPSINKNGSHVAFVSQASDHVAGFTGPSFREQIYVWERATGTFTLASHAVGMPTQGSNQFNRRPPIVSGDGTHVLFASQSTDLVTGFVANTTTSLYLFELATGTNTLVSHSTAGPAASANADVDTFSTQTHFPSISDDGAFVVYETAATDLVAGFTDHNAGDKDLFLFTGATGANTLISHSTAGAAETGDDASTEGVLSADGAFVAFTSAAKDLISGLTLPASSFATQIYLWERATDTLTLVSRVDGDPTAGGSSRSSKPVISPDGSFVAFTSSSSNLLPPGSSAFGTNVYIWERATGNIVLASHTPGNPFEGAGGDMWRLFGATAPLSSDGQFLAYTGSWIAQVNGVTDVNGFNNDDVYLFSAAAIDADLELSKTDSPDPVAPGATLTYTLEVENLSATPAVNVVVTDALPAGTTFVSASGTGWTCNEAGGVVTCQLGMLAATTTSAAITIDVTAPLTPAVLTNTAQVASAVNDPDPSNNSATTETLIVGTVFDWGDAPDPTYPTLAASDGARHLVDGSSVFLGASVDDEPDGLQSANATGDDTTGSDDEDGVVFTSNLIQGQAATVDIVAGAAGLLDAWIDFDGDGAWSHPGELVFDNELLAAGVNSLGFAVPAAAATGTTVARFRFSTAGTALPTGFALDGEVEDLEVAIIAPPPHGFSKVFSPESINAGGTSTLTFTIDNSANPAAASSLAFTDTLPAGVVVATPNGAVDGCSGSLTAVAGTGTVTYSGGSVAASSICTISVDVTSSAAGDHVNVSGTLTSSQGSNGVAIGRLSVLPNIPGFAKAFSPGSIPSGGTSTLTLTIDNTANGQALADLDFTDNLPAGMTIAAAPAASTTCIGGTLNATPATSTITYTGGTAPSASACGVTVPVTSSTLGVAVNTTGALTSDAGSSGVAAAGLAVISATFTVDSTGDGGDSNPGDGTCDGGGGCTLRAAIEETNALAGPDLIDFNVGGGGAQTITLGSVLPTITESVAIDGSTQPGFAGTPLIDVDAGGLAGDAMSVSNVVGLLLQDFRISNAAEVALDLSNADTAVVDGLDVSDVGDAFAGDFGLRANGCDDLTIQNVTATDRRVGIDVRNGSDARVLDNDVSRGGASNSSENYALFFKGVTASTLPGGVLISGNTFTDSLQGIGLHDMADLVVSDGSVAGTNVTLENASGLKSTGVDGPAVELRNVDDSLVDTIDVSETAAVGVQDKGLAVRDCNTVTVRNVTTTDRSVGIEVRGGTDIQVTNNDVSRGGQSGSSTRFALYVQGVTANTLPGGVLISGNTFTGSLQGIGLHDMVDLVISDGSAAGTNVTLENTSGLKSSGIDGPAVELRNVDDSLVDTIDVSETAAVAIQDKGLSVRDCDTLTIRDVTATDRATGIEARGGSDVQIIDNDLSRGGQSGASERYALFVELVTENVLPGGLLVSGNTFTDSLQGVAIEDLSGLVISDGSVAGSHVVLEPGNGLTSTGVDGPALQLRFTDNFTVDGLDLSDATGALTNSRGFRARDSTNLTLQNLTIKDRVTGIEMQGTNTGALSCSYLRGNTTGVFLFSGASAGLQVVDNHMQGNSSFAARNTNGDALDAENNFWGAADGSSTDGGSGDAHDGNVDAVPFSATSPICVPADLDYGDAPSPYPTLLTDDGARHDDDGATLEIGTAFDNDVDGQPNADATGDDTLDSGDDEDGITFTTTVEAGMAAAVDVEVTDAGTAGVLSAWIDFDQNGSWLDAGEQIATDVAVPSVSGSQTITINFNVPAGASLGNTFARFRLDSAGGLTPTGLAADGEVEDVQVGVTSQLADLQITKTVDDGDVDIGDQVTFTVTVTNNGPLTATGVTVDDLLPASFTFVSKNPSQGTYDELTGEWDLGLLINGSSATLDITVEVTPEPDAPSGNGAPLGAFVTSGSGGVVSPEGLTFGPDGNLYVVSRDTNQVLRYNGATGVFSGIFVDVAGGLSLARGLVFGPDGNLYVCNQGTGQVRRYNGTTGAFIDAFAAPAGSPQMKPTFGPDGNLYVADFGSGVVRRFNGTTGVPIGTGIFVTAGSGGLSGPRGVAFDPAGNLYVTSQFTHQVLRYQGPSGASPGAFIDVFGTGGGSFPVGLTFGPDGNLFVASLVFGIARYDGTTGAFLGNYVPSGGFVDLVFGPDGHLYASGGSNEVLRYQGFTSNTAEITAVDQIDPNLANNLAVAGVAFTPFDFGDAPDPLVATAGKYPTLFANDGARHGGDGTSLKIGTVWDSEGNGQPNADATGDDVGGAGDDEDGVSFTTALKQGASASMSVTVTDDFTASKINAWIDFDQDGDWDDPGEQIATDFPVPALFGTQTVNVGFTVPGGASLGVSFARVRLDSGGGLSPTGLAADGEVEDLETPAITVATDADLGVTKTVDVANPMPGGTVVFTVSVTNNGPLTATGVTVNDVLPASLGFVSDNPSQGTYDDLTGDWDLGAAPLASGATATLEITATAGLDPADPAGSGQFIDDFVSFGSGGLSFPTSVTFGPGGDLYVSSWNTSEVKRYDGSTGAFVSNFVTSGLGGLSWPYGTAFGPDGNFYVADAVFSGKVWRYDGTTGAFVDQFVATSAGGLSNPQGLTFGPDGNLYVANANTNEVLRFDGTSGAFSGVFVDAADGLSNPIDLAFGPDSNLYVTSFFSHEVLRFDGTTGALIDDFVPFGSGGLFFPYGVTFGPDGHLYVSIDGQRVLRYDGATGNFIDEFVPQGSGGLSTALDLAFGPDGHLYVASGANQVLRYDGFLLNVAQVTASDQSDPNTTNDAGVAGIAVLKPDYGDAPAPYPTLDGDDGARHQGGGRALRIGTAFDTEVDGQPEASALGDDNSGIDDEDGVTFTTPLLPGQAATVEVVVTDDGTAGLLNAWIDFDQDGSWEASEQIATDLAVTPVTGTQTLSVGFTVPAAATLGQTFARFRVDSGGGLSPTGLAVDGEVEDHLTDAIVASVPPPVFTKSFNPTTLEVGEIGFVHLNIDNGAHPGLVGNLAVTDVLPPGMVVADPSLAGSTCVGGFVNAVPGTSSISYSGGRVPASSFCSVNVQITSSTVGTHLNVTGDLTSDGGNSGSASASLTVDPSTGGGACTVGGVTIQAPYCGDYSVADPGFPSGVSFSYAGPLFLPPGSDTLLVGGGAESASGAIYSIPVTRDAFGHIDGFGGSATQWSTAPTIEGSLALHPTAGPPAVVFFAQWPTNRLGQIKDGSTVPDKEIDLGPFGVASSSAGVQFVPAGFPGAGQLKLVSWSGGQWYDLALSPDGSGTFDVTSATLRVTLGGGPLGMTYVPAGSPQFPNPSVLVADWSFGRISAYEVDANGDPILATRADFATGLGAAAGGAFDEVSGDFVFTTFSDIVVFRGFDAPPFVPNLDFGDAPAPYPTLEIDDGARHVAGGFPRLGFVLDDEPDGLPSAGADGDDLDGSDDEDGIVFTTALAEGQMASVDVTITDAGVATVLNAWIDADQNGDWNGTGEQIITDYVTQPISGTQTVSVDFTVPAGATLGATFARFRLSTVALLAPTGQAFDGEVEDYPTPPIMLGASADLTLDKSDTVDPVDVGSAFSYVIDVTNLGPTAADDLEVVDTLPAGMIFTSASGTGWTCGEAAGVVTCTRPTLAVGAAPPITIDVLAPALGGLYDNQATVSSTTPEPVPGNESDSEITEVREAGEVFEPDPIAALGGALSMMLADVDGDGDLDAVAAGSADDTILLVRNTGDTRGLSWSPVTIDGAFDGARSVFVGDVDADGDADVLGAAEVAGEVAWWENTAGDGSAWTKHSIDAAFADATAVTGIDADGDGDLDVFGGGDSTGQVSWWENTAGDGSAWTERSITAAFPGAQTLRGADLDRDGDADLVGGGDAGPSWWENASGDGSAWTERTISAAFAETASVDAADLDRDGDLDVLGASQQGDEQAWWENLTGDATSWTKHTIDAAVDGARSTLAVDLDLDGDFDVAGSAFDGDEVAWWENTAGDASAWTKRSVDRSVDGASEVFAADVDQDGDVDLLGGASEAGTVLVWENLSLHRSASNQEVAVIETGFDGAIFVKPGDIDGDGDEDVVASAVDAAEIAWFANSGDSRLPTWTRTSVATGLPGVWEVELSDLDVDGDLDVLAAVFFNQEVAWWENTAGDGSAWTLHMVATGIDGPRSVEPADVDGDGDPDVIGQGQGSHVVYWWENVAGDATVWTEHVLDPFFHGARSIVAADIDGDGDVDALGVGLQGDTVTWWENTAGDGSAWSEHPIDTSFNGAIDVFVGDLDRDGDLDALAAARDDDEIAWWENTAGDGSAWTKATIATGFNGTRSVYAADLDADGDIDVAGSARFGDEVAWFDNAAGDGSVWTKKVVDGALDVAGAVWSADLDRNGQPDLFACGEAAGEVRWYPNRGGQFALPTSDVTPAGFGDGDEEAMLEIVATHRGRADDGDLELVTLELRFDAADTRTALTDAEANALVETLSVYRDEAGGAAPGVWDGADVLVTSVGTLDLDGAGVQRVLFADGDPEAQVAHGTPRTYFVVAELTTDASAQTPAYFLLTHLTSSSSTADDRDHDVRLLLEESPDVTASSARLAELALTKTASSVTVEPGEPLTYTLTVTNAGPSTAEGVTITDTLPAGVTLVATSGCVEDPAGVPTCTVPNITSGGSAVVTVDVTVDLGTPVGGLVNEATVIATTSDLVPANNTATVETLVGGFGPTDLSLAKADDLGGMPALGGSSFEYVLTVSNLGPASSSGGTITDPLPPQVTFVGSSDGCLEAAGVVSCPFAPLAVGGDRALRFQVEVGPSPQLVLLNQAQVAGNESDAVPGNDLAELQTPTTDSVAPRVASVETVPAHPDGAIAQCQTVDLQLTGLVVRFDEQMFNPPGDSDPDDVTNPVNYRLLAPGPDAVLSTRFCGPVLGDDLAIPIDSVSYDLVNPGAILAVNGGTPLPEGIYRLLVCGSTTVRDLIGNPLDGNGNGVGGDDFEQRFRVEHDNTLVNGHFDCELAPWVGASTDPAEIFRGTNDVDGSNVSGSAQIENLTASTDFALAECTEVAPSTDYELVGRVLIDALPGVSVDLTPYCESFAAAQCAAPILSLGASVVPFTLQDTGGAWVTVESPISLPASAASAICGFELEAAGGEDFTAFLDAVRLSVEAILFADGFESGDTSEW